MSFKGNPKHIEECTSEEGYDRYAPMYVKEEAQITNIDQKLLLRHVRDLHGKNVLDLGCGTGRLDWLWRKRNADLVVGMDISEGMLAYAAKKGSYAKLIHADMREDFPFVWRSFDEIFLVYSLTHIATKELPHVFAELEHVLVEGGTIHIVILPSRRPQEKQADGTSFVIRTFHHGLQTLHEYLHDYGFIIEAQDEHMLDDGRHIHYMRASLPQRSA